MIIGLMSDSHDNLPKIKQAVEFFNKKKVKLVLHAGDFVAPFVVRELEKLSCPLIGVFGNNDGEREGLKKAIEKIGEIHPGPWELEQEGKKILLLHDPSTLNLKKLKKKRYDLIIYGHTHKAEIRKEQNLLLINPGECAGWLTHRPTIAWINLEEIKAEIVELSP
ncbi:metallophosphoesterase [Candidatus Aerophobetes bacterium]|nr:metallophosphoesterase [Candidatus Aerophobetes bacterium]